MSQVYVFQGTSAEPGQTYFLYCKAFPFFKFYTLCRLERYFRLAFVLNSNTCRSYGLILLKVNDFDDFPGWCGVLQYLHVCQPVNRNIRFINKTSPTAELALHTYSSYSLDLNLRQFSKRIFEKKGVWVIDSFVDLSLDCQALLFGLFYLQWSIYLYT